MQCCYHIYFAEFLDKEIMSSKHLYALSLNFFLYMHAPVLGCLISMQGISCWHPYFLRRWRRQLWNRKLKEELWLFHLPITSFLMQKAFASTKLILVKGRYRNVLHAKYFVSVCYLSCSSNCFGYLQSTFTYLSKPFFCQFACARKLIVPSCNLILHYNLLSYAFAWRVGKSLCLFGSIFSVSCVFSYSSNLIASNSSWTRENSHIREGGDISFSLLAWKSGKEPHGTYLQHTHSR